MKRKKKVVYSAVTESETRLRVPPSAEIIRERK